MKKRLITILLSLVVLSILFISISFLWYEKKNIVPQGDFIYPVKIDDEILKVIYTDNREIDVNLTYKEQLTKTFKVINDTDKELSFALDIADLYVTNEFLTYDLSYALTEDDSFNYLSQEKNLSNLLAYNLAIQAHSTLYFKVVITANKEETTTLKGTLNVVANKTEKEIFLSSMYPIKSALVNKVNSINGINKPGFYTLNLSDLELPFAGYTGYIIINAQDISSLKYIVTIWNKYYMVYNTDLDNITNKNIQKVNTQQVQSYNLGSLCALQSKNKCASFSTLKYEKYGGLSNFAKYTKEIYQAVFTDFAKRSLAAKIYIYDITKDINYKTPLNLYGYILVDNRQDKPEFYLYMTNNSLMISGYNITKYGDFNEDTHTIRAYNETAFTLAANDMLTVCTFTKLGSCYNLKGELLT